jgi:hypothetical protein
MAVGYFIPEFTFTSQLIIHCVLLFFLLLGMWYSNQAADKVREVHKIETKNRNGINEMKTAMQNLNDKMNDFNNLPEYFMQRVSTLEDNLRFISPANTNKAYSLENSFIEITNEINLALSDFAMNEMQIENNLKKLEKIYQNRKNIYSN